VELFHFKRQRKLSLRFLASYLLGLDIQATTHDSIEDARTAVRLYEKYIELVKEGNFQAKLLEIYRHGKQHGFTGERAPEAAPGAAPGAGAGAGGDGGSGGEGVRGMVGSMSTTSMNEMMSPPRPPKPPSSPGPSPGRRPP